MQSFKTIDAKKWQPPPDEVEKIQEEFRERYYHHTPAPAQFLQQCAKISCFLHDHNAFCTQLKKLDDLIGEKIKSVDPSKVKVAILTELFETELEKLGFHKHLGKTLGQLLPFSFRQALIYGLHLKDAGLGADPHREFPHIIQWILIGWQQQDSNFLGENQNVADIYKKLGHDFSVYEDRNYGNEKNIWDDLVDSLEQKNFSSPEYTSRFLENEKSEINFPNLFKFLKMRGDERDFSDSSKKFKKKYSTQSHPDNTFKRKTYDPDIRSAKPNYFRTNDSKLLFPITLKEEIKKKESMDKNFFAAVKSNDLGMVIDQIKKGADVNAIIDDTLPLYIACEKGNVEIAEVLIQHGAHVDKMKKNIETTPIMVATKNGHLQIVKLLLENGVDINGYPSYKAIFIAVENRDEEIVKILIQNKINVNETLGKETALFIAAKKGYPEIVKILIDNKANVNKNADNGISPLVIAANNNHFDIVRLLLSAGANPSIPTELEFDDKSNIFLLINYLSKSNDYLKYSPEHRRAMELCCQLCLQKNHQGVYLLNEKEALDLISELATIESSINISGLFSGDVFGKFIKKYEDKSPATIEKIYNNPTKE